MRSRNPVLDQIKALACLTIVCHHLAFYGPMADVLQPALKSLIRAFSQYGVMAVPVFLVIGGYCCASAQAPQGWLRSERIAHTLAQRVCRLSLPFCVALVLAIVVNETVRHLGFNHPAVAQTPTWSSVPAHLLLIHPLGGWEPLIAGTWYIAIDFQLYALCLLWIWLCTRWSTLRWLGPLGIGVATLLALYQWSHSSGVSAWPLYFLGAYGLGMMAWWGSNPTSSSRQRICSGVALVAMGAISLAQQWHWGIAVAVLSALLLMVLTHGRHHQWWPTWRSALLCWIGERSYSIFLLHFPLMLLVNAEISRAWPHDMTAHAMGMVLTLGISIFAGDLLYEFSERVRISWTQLPRWYWAPLGASWLASMTKLF